MLRFEGICKSFGARPVLEGVGGTFGPGAFALRGPNGIGKSTLLRVLAGALEPERGALWIDGLALHAEPRAEPRTEPHAATARLAYAPDECPVYPFLTGREFLAFVAWAKRCALAPAVLQVAEGLGLARHLDTRCGDMSLGTQKKLMLTASWIGEPAVLLLDEPSNGLDAQARAVLVELLAAKRVGATVLMSTHEHPFAAALQAQVIEFESLRTPDAR